MSKKKKNKISQILNSELISEISNYHIEVPSTVTLQHQIASHLEKYAKDYTSSIQVPDISQSMEIIKQYTSSVTSLMADFRERFKDFVPSMTYTMNRLPDAMIELGNGGWFFDYDATPAIVVELADQLNLGYKLDVDQRMIQYYEEHLEEILFTISKRHPERKHIIDEVLLCYNNRMYYAGIPTILAQIDGICNHHTNSDMFRSQDSKPRVFASITANSKKPESFLLSPIRKNPAISRNEKFQIPGELNRHLVMHGKDTQYGNRANFFKSLSLLKYLSDVLYFRSFEGDIA